MLPSHCCIDVDLSGSPAFPVPQVMNHTQVVHILELRPGLHSWEGQDSYPEHSTAGQEAASGWEKAPQHSALSCGANVKARVTVSYVLCCLFSAHVCVYPFTCICLELHTLSPFSWALINLCQVSEGLFGSLPGRTSHKAEPPGYLLRLAKR